MTFIKALPDCWWITPDILCESEAHTLLALLEMRKAQGIFHIQFRQTQLSTKAFRSVYESVFAYCQANGMVMMMNTTPAQVTQFDVKACYLNADVLMHCVKRPLSKEYVLGAYCHNLTELLHAQTLGLDFVSLSPVQKTLSHPEQTPLGWDVFQQLVCQTTLPVYALGGLSLSDKAKAIACGAQGIMGIRFT